MRGQANEPVHDAAHTRDMVDDNNAARWEIDFTGWLRRAFGSTHDRNAVVTMAPNGKIVCVDRVDGA